MIKPEFWGDEKVIELSAWARLLFIGLWNHSDDKGIMKYSPRAIKAKILPADNVDIDELLQELLTFNMIKTYEHGGGKWLWVIHFKKHQSINKPKPSDYPVPEDYVEYCEYTGTGTDEERNDTGTGTDGYREQDKTRQDKLSQINKRQDKTNANDFPKIETESVVSCLFPSFEKENGVVSLVSCPKDQRTLEKLDAEYGREWVEDAYHQAKEHPKRIESPWGFIIGVLRNWKKEGKPKSRYPDEETEGLQKLREKYGSRKAKEKAGLTDGVG